MEWVNLARAGAALLITVGAMLALYLGTQRLTPMLQRFQAAAPKRPLRVVQALPVDAKRKAIVLQYQGREHLVLTGPGGDVLLESRDCTDAPPPMRTLSETNEPVIRQASPNEDGAENKLARGPFTPATAWLARLRTASPVVRAEASS